MKKFRFLLALVVVVTMLTTVAMACADDSLDGYGVAVPASVTYADGIATFDVNVVSPETTAYTFCQVNITYDTAWAVELLSVDSKFDIKKVENGLITLAASTGGTYDNGAKIATIKATAAAVPANADFVITKVDFWGDDDYIYCECDCGEGYKTVAVEAAAAAADPTIVSATVDPKATFKGETDTYTGVWFGSYEVALNGNDITKVGLRFAGKSDDAFAVEKAADGEGNVSFKIAIVGAPANAVATPIVYNAAWIAAVAE